MPSHAVEPGESLASRRPRVVIDGRFIQDRFPGVGRFCYGLIAALAELELGIDLVVPIAAAPLNTRFDLAALPHRRMSLVPSGAPVFSLREQAAMPRLARAVGAALWHSPHPAAPLLLPCRLAVSCHDAIPLLQPASLAARWRRPAAALLLRRSVRAASIVVTGTCAAREDVVRVLGAARERTVVIPHGVDRRFAPQPGAAVAAVRERFGLPPLYALHLSSGKAHKNVAGLLEAWHRGAGSPQREGVALAVAGGAADNRDSATGPSVRFLGAVDETDLPALYTGASVFVFPSLVEGFGLPVLEAMACGTPVVCSDASSLPEVVGDAAVLCDPTDASALAAAIARVLGDGDLRTAMRQRGLARAARFTWEETARRFAQLYGDVLAQRPRTGGRGSGR